MVYATVIVTFLQELHFLSCLRVSKPTSCPTTSTSCLCKLDGMFLKKNFVKTCNMVSPNPSFNKYNLRVLTWHWVPSKMTDRYFTLLDSVCGTWILETKSRTVKTNQPKNNIWYTSYTAYVIRSIAYFNSKTCFLLSSFWCSFI